MTQRGAREARLLEREDLTSTLAVFRFAPEGGVPPFVPGQYVAIGLPREDDPSRALWRPYSIASEPEEERHLELYVRRAERPVAGELTSRLWSLRPGDRLLWRPPKGAFTIDERRPDGAPERRRLVLLGGGTGLAPFLSYARHLHRRGTSREIVLGHGARYVDELGFRDLLERFARESEEGRPAWRFHYLPTISRPAEERNRGWHGLFGRVEELVRTFEGGGPSPVESAVGEPLAPETTIVHVCGFQGTVTAALGVLEPMGFRTRSRAREDGTFDLKVESYG